MADTPTANSVDIQEVGAQQSAESALDQVKGQLSATRSRQQRLERSFWMFLIFQHILKYLDSKDFFQTYVCANILYKEFSIHDQSQELDDFHKLQLYIPWQTQPARRFWTRTGISSPSALTQPLLPRDQSSRSLPQELIRSLQPSHVQDARAVSHLSHITLTFCWRWWMLNHHKSSHFWMFFMILLYF